VFKRMTARAAAAVAMVGALALSGCSADPAADEPTAASSDGSFPVTIEHAFGETTIPEAPKNVVTWGWGSTEASIAVGVVPVAIPFQSYAGDDTGMLPWVDEELTAMDAETPTILTDDGEAPPYEEIAAADPDVILAVYSGVTEEQYALLSAIAPTVAYPDNAWTTPWKDVVTTVGKALGKSAEAEEVLSGIDDVLAEGAAAHPELKGKSIAAVWDTSGTFYVYRAADPRVSFLLDLGLVNAPAVDDLATGDATFFYTLSYEQLDKLDSDIVITYADSQEAQDAFLATSYAQAIPAVKAGAVAPVVGKELVSSVSPPTALSLTWGLDRYLDSLSTAATAADAAK
jgi:iron complex transport system substrate-binding protein